jgi:hypothetical protein
MNGQNISKREAIATILKKHPELTDRAIAKMVEIEIGSYVVVSVSHPTVADVRKDLEEKGDIPRIDPIERLEAGGRRARGRKPG